MLLEAATVGLLAALVCWILNPLKRWRYRNIPGPVGWPIIGNLVEFAVKGSPQLCQELEPKYGKVFKLWFGSTPWVVVSDPDWARKLSLRFNTRPSFEYLNTLPRSEVVLQHKGIFGTVDMPLWRVLRKAFDASLLLPVSLAQYTPTMDSCVVRLINKLQIVAASGQTIDMWRALGDMTLEVVGECAYGIDLHSVVDGRKCSKQQQALGQELVAACRSTFKQLLLPLAFSPAVRWMANMFPDAKQTENVKARRHMKAVSESLISGWKEAHPKIDLVKEAPAKQTDGQDGITPASGPTAQFTKKVSQAPDLQISTHSFLNSLLSAPGVPDSALGMYVRKIDDASIVEQAITFILAGYETTANTLAFAIYLLAVNPEAEACLMKEVDAFGRVRPITAADLDQFPYADAVIKESLRLHTPLGTTMRLATQEVEVLGKTIPKGAVLVFPAHTFHNSEEYWKRPSEFLPERFLTQGQAKLGPTTANAHMPFGLGGRMCPGYKFAQQEAKISLVRLFQNFTFTLAPGMPRSPRTVTGFTTGPADGVPVIVHRRK